MAIGDADWVVPETILGPDTAAILDGSPWLAQPPHVGITSNAQGGPPATAVDVLWDTGFFNTSVPVGSLRQIEPPTAQTISDFSGKVVRRTVNNQSGEFIGVPVLLAQMDTAAGPIQFAIVKTLGPAAAYWASDCADLEVVTGR